MVTATTIATVFVLVVVGLLATFAGRRLLRNSVAFVGGIAGAIILGAAGTLVAGPVGFVAGAVVGFALGALLFVAAYRLAVAILGGFVGASVASGIAALFLVPVPVLVPIIGAIVGGILAFVYHHHAVVAVTAIGGALLLTAAAGILFAGQDPAEPLRVNVTTWQFLLFLALAAAGITVQWREGRATGEMR